MLLNKGAAAARICTGRWTESPDLNSQLRPWKIPSMSMTQINYFLLELDTFRSKAY